MKKLSIILCISVLVILLTSLAMAGGITTKQNFSIEYDRTASRNSSNNSADAAVYNPAGVMQLEDGFYLNAGAFYVLKDYSNTIGGTEHASDEPSLIPSLIGLYKKDKWAAFGAITIPGGGGEVTYNNGTATTQGYGALLMMGANLAMTQPPYSLPYAEYYDTISSQSLKAESIYYGLSFGGAYEVNDLVSIALGMRFIKADKESQASMTISSPFINMPDQSFNIDYEEKADGVGGFFGVNITPNESLNIGLRYETSTKLDFETTVNRDDTGMLTDGAKEREDLPGLLGIGVGYDINPDLRLDTSITYYFEKEATREDSRFDDVGNGYDLAVAVEYALNPKLTGSLGYMRTIVDISPDDMQPEAPELDAHTVAAGLLYALSPTLDLNFSLMKNFYKSETRSDGIELNKGLFCMGFGVQYKFNMP